MGTLTVPRSSPLLRITGLSKTFGPTRALRHVDLEVFAGEVHALVGENGSGKSTLIKILSGFHAPDPGAVAEFDGGPLVLGRGTDARILFVHQDRALISSLTVRENLGLELGARRVLGRLRNRDERLQAHRLLSTFELDIDGDALVGELTPFEQSAVAIVRCLGALDDRARLLVLDEPTAALGSADAARLFDVLRRVNASGVALLYVSHFLDEVLALADRITVLRDGRKIATRDAAATSEAELVRVVVGHELETGRVAPAREDTDRPPVLRVHGLRAPGLQALDLDLAEHEVLGLTGIVGSGYEVLPECLAGGLTWAAGSVAVGAEVHTRIDPRRALAAGIVTMPADRMRRGLIGTLSVAENITLPQIGAGWRGGRVHRREIDSDVRRWILKTGVVPPDPARPVAGAQRRQSAEGAVRQSAAARSAGVGRLRADAGGRRRRERRHPPTHRDCSGRTGPRCDRRLVGRDRAGGDLPPRAGLRRRQGAGRVARRRDHRGPDPARDPFSAGEPMTSTARTSLGTRSERGRRVRAALSVRRISGVYLWLALIVLYSLASSNFLTATTARTIANEQAVTAIVALGLTVALVAGVFDLSIAGVMGLSNIVVARLMADAGWSPVLAIVVTLTLMALIGVINGLLVVRARIDPFITTLGTNSILLAAIYVTSNNENVLGIPPGFTKLADNAVFGIPLPMFYVVALALLLWYVLAWTPLGRRLYATGGGREAARLAGVPTDRYIVGAFVCSATVAALAGVLVVATLGTGSTEIGPSYLLPAFAAGFLGATQFVPGRFNVWGTVLAVYLLATGVKGLVILGADVWVPDLFNGLALLIAVGVASTTFRPSFRRRRSPRPQEFE